MLAAPARRIALALLLVCLTAGSARAAAPAPLLPPYRPAVDEPAKTADDRNFDALINEWFAGEVATRPAWATGTGTSPTTTLPLLRFCNTCFIPC